MLFHYPECSKKWVRSAITKEQRPVFGVGLPRNATTSLSQAFGQLGYQSYHPPFHLDVSWYNHPRIFCADTPLFVPELFTAIDARIPALFIYTFRNVDQWMQSIYNYGLVAWGSQHFSHFAPHTEAERQAATDHWAYSMVLSWPFNATIWRQRYLAHQTFVGKYFRGRDNFMEIALPDLDWEPICRFVGATTPSTPFPHVNFTVSPTASSQVDSSLILSHSNQ